MAASVREEGVGESGRGKGQVIAHEIRQFIGVMAASESVDGTEGKCRVSGTGYGQAVHL